MRFVDTGLPGAFIVELEPHCDERGFFARTWCRDEFAARGLNPCLVQCSLSRNRLKGTLRGMHYQVAPHEEAKLVRCTMGAIYDVIVDLRPSSPTRHRYFGAVLSAHNHRALYVPEGFAHGFLTLEDDSEVLYQMSASFHAASARGVRWNDAAFGITWPSPPVIIADRDASYPDVTLAGASA
jgi:dTDP-4-dehydrorhamnose 3,5-epimerase